MIDVQNKNAITPSPECFEVHDEWICIRFRGTFESRYLLPFALRAMELSLKHNINRVLFDIRGCMDRASIERKITVADNMQGQWIPSVRLALLAREDQNSEDRFFQTAAANRGFEVGGFTHEKVALEWLLAPL